MTRRVILAFAAVAMAACNAPAVLTQQVEAQRLVSELRIQFSKGTDASNRAVMADADEDSAAAAREAERVAQDVQRDVDQLRTVLTSMGYSEELEILNIFSGRFAEYLRLDAEILPLAVENTNLKAQRLSFGPAAEAVAAFRSALDALVKSAPPSGSSRVELLAARAGAAVLEIQVLQAPHIAEPTDDAMTRMEAQMAASEVLARKTLEQIATLLPSESRSHVMVATAALDRFTSINKDIVTLSRRNSGVRSLALSLGRKRMITAQCDEQLGALEATLAKHTLGPTR
jgi:hypothetical protein